ncbi:aminotransferase class IV [Actinoplanes sp. NPDC049681]|uniref:aminotransferase class IV n=1 Tax=Actinoplanes sp. NPDC049681 TaxID=3363905 RepID=UPI00379B7377
MDVELNGREPGVAELHRLLLLNYGHFTSFQVRDGRVRGLALHLARLADGAEELFGHRIGVEEEHRLLALVRHALGPARDASVRVTFVPGPGGDEGPPDVLVSVSDPAPEPPGPPLRVQTVTYERDLPEHKHRGTFMLDHHYREARLAGFDDRLFVGRDGRVREGTSWNVALWDGDQVVWPQAPVLKGVTMVLLQIAMTMNGTPWALRPVAAADLTAFPGAAAVNSHGVRGIASVDEVPATDTRLVKLLAETWAEVPWDEL